MAKTSNGRVQEADAEKDALDWRDAQGRFCKGNPGGPGRPARQTEIDYLRVIISRCTLEVWERIVDRAVADAENGDAAARKWLSEWCLRNTPSLLELAVIDWTEADYQLEQLTEAMYERTRRRKAFERQMQYDRLIDGE